MYYLDCFRLFEADFRITDEAVNERVVAFDVADCQLACTDNGFRQDYQCRSFAFTDDKEALDKGNCHLSSQDPRDSGFRRFIIRNIGYNLYERRSSSFCNNDKFSTQTSTHKHTQTFYTVLGYQKYTKCLKIVHFLLFPVNKSKRFFRVSCSLFSNSTVNLAINYESRNNDKSHNYTESLDDTIMEGSIEKSQNFDKSHYNDAKAYHNYKISLHFIVIHTWTWVSPPHAVIHRLYTVTPL